MYTKEILLKNVNFTKMTILLSASRHFINNRKRTAVNGQIPPCAIRSKQTKSDDLTPKTVIQMACHWLANGGSRLYAAQICLPGLLQ